MGINHVHLVWAHVDQFQTEYYSSDPYLDKFIDLNRKKESIAARMLLNQLCQKHLGRSLSDLNFTKDAYGKPTVSGSFCSISHCQGWVFVGLGSVNFGLDLEYLDLIHSQQLKEAFSDSEWKEISGHPEKVFTQFSIKESVSKCQGQGFLISPNEIKIPTHGTILNWAHELEVKKKYVFSFYSNEKVEIFFEKL